MSARKVVQFRRRPDPEVRLAIAIEVARRAAYRTERFFNTREIIEAICADSGVQAAYAGMPAEPSNFDDALYIRVSGHLRATEDANRCCPHCGEPLEEDEAAS